MNQMATVKYMTMGNGRTNEWLDGIRQSLAGSVRKAFSSRSNGGNDMAEATWTCTCNFVGTACHFYQDIGTVSH